MTTRLKKTISCFLILATVLANLGTALVGNPQKAKAAYDRNNLVADDAFINANALGLAGIQSLLVSKGSFLASYSEGGRSAAQIIYDVAHGVNLGDAYGWWPSDLNQKVFLNSNTGTINPVAILATLQKEMGIVTGVNAQTLNQSRLDWAMGYGCPDGQGCNETYRGFTKQVTWGAAQLRYNYHRASGMGFGDYQVGQTVTIDGQSVTYGNRATASLYRYTPHLQGNYNFNYYFNIWEGAGVYGATFSAQGPRSGAGAWGVEILPYQNFTIWVNYKNTGTKTWYKTGATAARLGTAGPGFRKSVFLPSISSRGTLVQSSVAPGQVGTFTIKLRAPLQQGTYIEKFQPYIEGTQWIGQPSYWVFPVSTAQAVSQTKAAYYTQGPKTGPASWSGSMTKGSTATLWVSMKNTGTRNWYRAGDNPTHLGTADPIGRKSVFLGGTSRRGYLVQSVVKPGEIGTFQINVTAPQTAGVYYEKFQLVTEYVTFFGPIISWRLTVR